MYTQLPEVKDLARRAFPDYTGTKFKIEPFGGPQVLASYWDGGCRDYWALVNMVTGRTWHVPENGTPYVNGGKTFRMGRLPMNIALVNFYRGRFQTVTIFLNPDNIRQDMLPAPVELSWSEQVVLFATRSLKSSYAGIKNYRFHEAHERTGITTPEWETAKAACIQRGLLNKAGAITDAGRNAMPYERCPGFHALKRPLPIAA